MDTIQKGLLTELQCQLDFTKLGYIVSQPISPCRYDFLVDIGKRIIKVQCKTCRESQIGAIIFECRSCRGTTKGYSHRKYTSDEIDYFYTNWEGIGYLIPVQECSNNKTIRFIPPANNRRQGITFAEDCTIEKTLERIEKI